MTFINQSNPRSTPLSLSPQSGKTEVASPGSSRLYVVLASLILIPEAIDEVVQVSINFILKAVRGELVDEIMRGEFNLAAVASSDLVMPTEKGSLDGEAEVSDTDLE